MIERGSGVPSSMPRRCDSEPAHVHGLDVVRGNPDRVQVLHDEPADLVVDHALAFEDRLLLGVEGGRVVLEILDERARFWPLEQDLGLAFVDLLATGHRPLLEGWPLPGPVARYAAESTAARSPRT
jgi:hypothetical protein